MEKYPRIVVYNEFDSKIVIKAKDFDPRIHRHLEEGTAVKEAEIVLDRSEQLEKVREEGKVDEVAQAISDANADADKPQDPEMVKAVDDDMAEFEELKANKGWLKKETKERYKELKEKLGK